MDVVDKKSLIDRFKQKIDNLGIFNKTSTGLLVDTLTQSIDELKKEDKEIYRKNKFHFDPTIYDHLDDDALKIVASNLEYELRSYTDDCKDYTHPDYWDLIQMRDYVLKKLL